MSHERIFYHLKPTTMSSYDMTNEAYAEAERTWLCPGCKEPLPGVQAVDLQLDASQITDIPLTFESGTGVPMALKSFLFQLDRRIINRDLMLGRVYGSDGEELNSWCTYRGRRSIIVRGSDEEDCKATYRRCGVCGRIMYFAFGTHYLYPSPPTDAELYDAGQSLIIPDYLFRGIQIPKYATINVERLEVLDAPLDGFGILERK